MNKRNTTLSVAAVFAASVLALQAPIAGAQDNSASSSQQGVPGVEMNVGDNASDRGLPGVEMNAGAQGDQNNIDTNVDTSTLGAGSADTSIGADSEDSTLSPRADRG